MKTFNKYQKKWEVEMQKLRLQYQMLELEEYLEELKELKTLILKKETDEGGS